MGINDFISEDIGAVGKVVTALKYLNQGRTLKLGMYEVRIAEVIDGGFQFVMRMEDNSQDGYWIGFPGDIIHFSSLCNNLTEKEILNMQAEMALTSMKRENAKRRGV